MGRFSNHCNNRFRGAFKHAVNQGIKEYQKNKQNNNKENPYFSQTVSDESINIFLIIAIIIVLLIGNLALFFGGQNKYIFENGLAIVFAFFNPFVDALLIYFGTLKICGMISNRKEVKIFAKIIAIMLILILVFLIIFCYLPRCCNCDKVVLVDYVTIYANKRECYNCYNH